MGVRLERRRHGALGVVQCCASERRRGWEEHLTTALSAYEAADQLDDPLVETLFAQFHVSANGRRLFVATEPLVPTADGMRVAAGTIDVLGETFQSAQGSLAAALRAACDAANDRVRDANQPATGPALEERVYIGLTAVAVERDAMLIAQAPPGQVLVVQDDRLYAIPSLDSWRSDYDVDADDEAPRPLGAGPRLALRLSATTAAPRDRVILCASALGACLSRGLDVARAYPADLLPALTADSTELAADLDDLAAELGAGRGLSACVHDLESGDHWIWTAAFPDATDLPPTASPHEHVVVGHNDMGATTALVRSVAGGESFAPVAGAGALTDPESDATSSPLSWDNGPQPRGRRWFGRSLESMDHIQIACVTACERILGRIPFRPRRRERRAPSFTAPGARSMHLYRNSITNPVSLTVRAHLPRGPMVHVPVRFLSVLVVAMLLVAGAGYFYDRGRDRDARADTFLARADAQLRTLANASDPTAVASVLGAAQSALDNARSSGAGDQLVASRQATVDAARDALRGIDRLENMARIGTLPPPDGDGDGPSRLVIIGRDVYLLSDALYHVDPQSRSLTRLLDHGMRIERATVHELTDVTVDDGVLTATDGLAIYRLRGNGTWDRQRIGRVDGKTPWDVTACGAFQGSFYLLDGENGQILKFPVEQFKSLPNDWAGPTARDELAGAVDFVIDGRIYVLLPDGSIATYYQGEEEDPLPIELDPGITKPAALFGGSNTSYLYVSDRAGGSGRIARLDRAGGEARQYRLPRNAPPAAVDAFAAMDDFVVDEAIGVVYILSDGQLWAATIPLPENIALSG